MALQVLHRWCPLKKEVMVIMALSPSVYSDIGKQKEVHSGTESVITNSPPETHSPYLKIKMAICMVSPANGNHL